MNLGQLNLLCADVDLSRTFYETLGLTFRAISQPGARSAAYLTTIGSTGFALHSVGFARWWDPLSPGATPGSCVFDLDVPTGTSVDAVVDALVAAGGTVVKDPETMEFGARYAIVTDPDGHRLGLRQPIGH